MRNDNLLMPIWGCRALPPNTSPYYDFHYDPPPAAEPGTSANTAALLEAQRLYDAGDHGGATRVLAGIVAVDDLARALLLDAT